MPYRSQIIPEAGCILSRPQGVLELEEMLAEIESWARSLQEDPRLRVLVVDHLGADVSGISMDIVKTVAAATEKLFRVCPDLNVVGVFGTPLEFGFGRVWHSWAAGDTRAWLVRTLSEAQEVLEELGVSLDLEDGTPSGRSHGPIELNRRGESDAGRPSEGSE